MAAPAVSLSHAVPPAPTVEIRCTDSAAPSWTETIAPTARDQGGTASAPGLRPLMGRDQAPVTPPRTVGDAPGSMTANENLAGTVVPFT